MYGSEYGSLYTYVSLYDCLTPLQHLRFYQGGDDDDDDIRSDQKETHHRDKMP